MQLTIDTDSAQGRVVLAAVDAYKDRLVAQVDAACKAGLQDARCPDEAAQEAAWVTAAMDASRPSVSKAQMASYAARINSALDDLLAASRDLRLDRIEVDMNVAIGAASRKAGREAKAQIALADGANALESLERDLNRVTGALDDIEALGKEFAALVEGRP